MAKKVRFFPKNYWYNEFIKRELSTRHEVLVEMLTSFVVQFGKQTDNAMDCIKAYNGQANMIYTAKKEVEKGYFLRNDWFKQMFTQMIIVSHKYSNKKKEDILIPLKYVFKGIGWDFDKVINGGTKYDTTFNIDFLSAVVDGEEKFDIVKVPIIPVDRYGQGSVLKMKNGKKWYVLSSIKGKLKCAHFNGNSETIRKFSYSTVNRMDLDEYYA